MPNSAQQFGALPADHRRVVSFHDAFPYFARAYGLEIVGVVVDAPGQDPSASEVAALIDAIRASGARAILAEVQFNDRLARQIAAETGAIVVSGLYTDSLGDPPARHVRGDRPPRRRPHPRGARVGRQAPNGPSRALARIFAVMVLSTTARVARVLGAVRLGVILAVVAALGHDAVFAARYGLGRELASAMRRAATTAGGARSCSP